MRSWLVVAGLFSATMVWWGRSAMAEDEAPPRNVLLPEGDAEDTATPFRLNRLGLAPPSFAPASPAENAALRAEELRYDTGNRQE
jgi:hypothetical protein